MKCMENLYRTQIPNDVVMDYLQLYKSIGNNGHNHEILEPDYDVMVRQTIRNDTYFFTKMFDINVSESRFKSLIHKGVKTKNKDEQILQNIYNGKLCQLVKYNSFESHFIIFKINVIREGTISTFY